MHRFFRKIRVLAVYVAFLFLTAMSAQIAVAQSDYEVAGLDSVATYYETLRSGGVARIIAKIDIPTTSIRSLGPKNAANEATGVALETATAVGVFVRRLADTDLIVLEASRDQLDHFLANVGVLNVEIDISEPANLNSALPSIQGELMHQDHAEGLGKTIVILDTGVDSAHPFLSNRIVGEACFSSNSASNSATSLCRDGAETDEGLGSGVPCAIDGCIHGTHVAGIAASSDGFNKGVAPSAGIIAIQIFSRFDDAAICEDAPVPCVRTFRSDQIEALQYVRNSLVQQHPIAAINMSVGGGAYSSCPNDLRASIINELRSIGVATVISSGNSSLVTQVGAPGCIPAAITVGATNDAGAVAGFSNSGPEVDLMAPGVAIRSSVPGGGNASLQGTSMAAPMVAGAIAALQSYHSLPVDEIETILKETGNIVATLNTSVSRSRLRLHDAWQEIDSNGDLDEAFVWMRDTWNDTGREPDPAVAGQIISSSPDVWVRLQQDCGTALNSHQNPEFGQPNVGCVMIRNSGKKQARGTLRLYYANANFDSGANWKLIEETDLTIPPQHTEISPALWHNVPAPGHYCMIAKWFPEGSSPALSFPGGFVNAVRNNNDLVWKNVNVVNVNSGNVSSSLVFEKGNDGLINMVIDMSALSAEEIGQIGELIINLGGDPKDLPSEGTSKYYQHDGRFIRIPLRSGVFYIPDIQISTTGQVSFELEFKFFDENNEKLSRQEFFANIDIFDVPDVAAHKQGEVGQYPRIRYSLTAR